jgi:hypothetical protein
LGMIRRAMPRHQRRARGTGHSSRRRCLFLEPEEMKRRVTSRVNYVVWAFGVEVYWAGCVLGPVNL